MAKYLIALNLRKFDYAALAVFAKVIHKGFVASTVFTNPVPSAAQQLADAILLEKRAAKWGVKGNRGSTYDLALLRTIRDKVRSNLKRLAGHCISIEPDDSQPALDVGFVLKGAYSKNGLLEAVIHPHQLLHPTIWLNYIKIIWRRPPNAPATTVITYKVLRSKVEDVLQAEQIAIVRRCEYTDKKVPSPGRWFYWIIPVNTAGDGAISGICMGVAFW